MTRRFFKAVLPLAAVGLLAACSGNVSWGGDFEGVPLAELDMTGDLPTGVAIYGPDKMVVSDGDSLDIDVEGESDVTDLLRFRVEDGVLAVGREGGDWKNSMGSSSVAIIRVTLPSVESIEVAGSGDIEASRAMGNVDIDIAGSGAASMAMIEARDLEIEIAGSGTVTGTGTADNLRLDIAGSGEVQFENVRIGDAEIDVSGSGDATFMSDGNVSADIAGSGDITVIGNATCSVETVGSGSVTCRPAPETADAS